MFSSVSTMTYLLAKPGEVSNKQNIGICNVAENQPTFFCEANHGARTIATVHRILSTSIKDESKALNRPAWSFAAAVRYNISGRNTRPIFSPIPTRQLLMPHLHRCASASGVEQCIFRTAKSTWTFPAKMNSRRKPRDLAKIQSQRKGPPDQLPEDKHLSNINKLWHPERVKSKHGNYPLRPGPAKQIFKASERTQAVYNKQWSCRSARIACTSRSCSREARIRVPFFLSSTLVGEPSPKKKLVKVGTTGGT